MGAPAWVCEACGTRGRERGGGLPADGNGAAVIGIFWDSPRDPALSPHLSSATQARILRETSLSWVVWVPRILSAAEQSGFGGRDALPLQRPPCVVTSPVCVPARERSSPNHLSPWGGGGEAPESERRLSDPLCSLGRFSNCWMWSALSIFFSRTSFPLFPSSPSQAEV